MIANSRVVAVSFVLALAAAVSRPAPAGTTTLTTELAASGILRPVGVTAPPGDVQRVFVVEQRGAIRIIKDGTLLATPFLDIDPLVHNVSVSDERGMLGLAFHPDYANNGYFYVYYIDTSPEPGDSRLVRYQVSGANPDLADPASAFQILTLDQPFENHNGGQLAFGPNDGYLYVGLGDGGWFNDPGNRAQDDTVWFGKLLRIDVNGDDFPADPARNYAIPPSNPFAGSGGNPREEIWAKGLRNPWRFSFDRANGDLYIGDVGQNAWEEIDYQPGTSTGKENYGWRRYEGNACILGPCDPTGITFPVHVYANPSVGCSVTGGVVYRGCAIPDLSGTYFFADWCSAKIWSFRIVGGAVTDFQDRTAELDPPGAATIARISSFGTDARGEIYICDLFDGEVFRIVPTAPVAQTGDFDCDGDVDLDDFGSFAACYNGANNPPAPACPPGVDADLDNDGDVDLDDFSIFAANYTGSL